ncbi:MAG TPA: alpha/beta fold hydrolase [Steroidobacteraceae bacterium]|nr:alpha/beta fold hydrolase [Steroidobacteraceae bacterium]
MKPAIVALALLFAGTAWAGAGELRLAPCADPKLKPAKCGTYTVWENREAKSGRTIDLAVVVLQATGQDRKPDPLFILLGGPGEAAASSGAEWYVEDPVRATRDIVLVDQRGTGNSNGLHCPVAKDAPLQDYVPTLNLAVLAKCRPELQKRADMRYYSTPYAMDDLDDIRAALGYDKINIDAGSYGTTAALVYIRQHGEHVREATLWASTALTQPMPLFMASDAENALRNVFRDCYAEAACKSAYPTLEADYKRAVAKIESGPVRVTVTDPRSKQPTEVTVDADAFAEGLRAMMYRPEAMRSIPLVLRKAAAGDYKAFADFQIGRNIGLNNALADGLYFSITCTEDVDRADPKQAQANGRGTFLADHRNRPHREGCVGWPRSKLPAGFGEEVKSDVPVLVINGANDPATPPSAGRAGISRMSNARLVVVPYGGHSSEGLIGEECVKSIAAKFLETADQKSLDVGCVKNMKHKPFVLSEKESG